MRDLAEGPENVNLVEVLGENRPRGGAKLGKYRPRSGDSCKADSCKRRLQSMNYACAIDHVQQGRPEIVESGHAPLPGHGINSIQLR